MIFPEGGIANGHCLMKFKKGAFFHKSPVKIYAFKMPLEDEYIFNYANMNPIVSIMLSFSQLNSSFELHEVEEPIDPFWVAEKHGIDINDENFWKVFAEECKDILSFVTGVEKTEDGFQELKEFEELECRKFDNLKLKLFNRGCDKSKKLN